MQDGTVCVVAGGDREAWRPMIGASSPAMETGSAAGQLAGCLRGALCAETNKGLHLSLRMLLRTRSMPGKC